MTRKLPVALLFGLLVVLAGCSGGGGDSSGPDATTTVPVGDRTTTEEPPATDTPTTTEEPPTTDTPTTTEEPPATGAPTTTEPPTTDVPTTTEPPTTAEPDDWARTDAETALRAAGSYTSTWTWRSNGTDTGEMTFTTRVDFDAERVHNTMRIDSDGVTVVENYYADGTQYTRMASGDGSDATYFHSQAAFDDLDTVWNYGFAYDTSDFDQWTETGTETYDGVTVRRYVFEATDQYLGNQSPGAEFEVTSARFEMLVDRDGVPRYQRYDVEGTGSDGAQETYEWELRVTDVASTTVTEPTWVQQAANQ